MEVTGFWSWIIMAVWTIGLFVLGWWFFMPNPMAKDGKKTNKENKDIKKQP